MKQFFKDIKFKVIAVSLLIIITTILSTTTLGYIINININNYTLIFDIILSFIIIHKVFKEEFNNNKIFIKYILIILFIIYLTSLIGMQYYDFYWDGNTYHKNLIGLLADGLNPINNTKAGDLWAIHYANAYEVIAGVFYSFFDNIEVGKCIDLILSIVLFYNIYETAFKMSKSKLKASLISIPLVLSPLFLSQFSTYYLDDVVGITLYLSILSLFNMIYDQDFQMKDKYHLITFICSTLICINLKFQALFICGLFSCLLGGYIIINNLIKKDYKVVFKLIGYFVLVYASGVLLIGSSTYVKNTILNNNAFYPLLGNKSVNLEDDNEPVNFQVLDNRFEKWLYATFSKTSINYDNVKMKVPFFIHQNELKDLKYPDLRIAGFGVWFSGLLCVSFAIGLLELIYLILKKSKWTIVLLLLVGGIVLPIPFLPIVRQARYYPQIYLLPFIVLFPLLSRKDLMSNLAFYIISLIAIVNVSFYIPNVIDSYNNSKELDSELLYLSDLSMQKQIFISTNDDSFKDLYFPGGLYNLRDKNIKFTYIQDKLTKNAQIIYGFYKYDALSNKEYMKLIKKYNGAKS